MVYREEDDLLKLTSVDHNLSSDHFCVSCSLNLSKPPIPRAYRQVRRLVSLDMAAFKISLQAGMPSEPTADELFHVLRSTLDKHATVTRRLIIDRPHSPWYNSVGHELLKAKRERRKVEKRWRTSGLTVHRQIVQQTRNKVTDIVHRAKSAYNFSPQRFLHVQQLNSYSVSQTVSLAKSTLLLFQPSIQCMNFRRNLLTSLLARLF